MFPSKYARAIATAALATFSVIGVSVALPAVAAPETAHAIELDGTKYKVGQKFSGKVHIKSSKKVVGTTIFQVNFTAGPLKGVHTSGTCKNATAACPSGTLSCEFTVTSVNPSNKTITFSWTGTPKGATNGVDRNELGLIGYQRIGGKYVAPGKFDGYVEIKKVSANPTFTSDNPNYSLKGAQYGVYADKKCTQKKATLTTDAKGNTPTAELSAGVYYVKEIKPSKGFELDEEVYEVDINNTTEGKPAIVKSKEEPGSGRLTFRKASTAAWTTSNRMYDISGAEYEVRDEDGKLWDTFVIRDKGGVGYSKATNSTKSTELPYGTYWLKETKPPKCGFKLSPTPIKATVSSNNEEPPPVKGSDFPIVHTNTSFGAKIDYDDYVTNKNYKAQGGAKLQSAVYEFKYYDVYVNKVSELKAADCRKTTQLRTVLVDGKALINIERSAQYNNGSVWGVPLGTYTVQEIVPPEGYQLDPTIHMVRITADSATNTAMHVIRNASGSGTTITEMSNQDIINENNRILSVEVPKKGDVSVSKYIEVTGDPELYPEGKKGAKGVKFDIINDNEFAVRRVDNGESASKDHPNIKVSANGNSWAQPGEVVYTIVTNDDGFASTRLITDDKGVHGIENKVDTSGKAPGTLPYGKYHFTERNAPEGYKPIKSYQFSVGENLEYRHYTLENKTGTAMRLCKVDDKTGKTVRGVTKFKLWKQEGNKRVPVTYQDKYPSNARLDVFTTDIDGMVFFPEKLMPGRYFIEEIEAPEGYLWSSQLLEVNITVDTITDYDHPLLVKYPNSAAQGKVIITKTDAETDGIITNDTTTYNIYADEDIVTQDGTVRAKKNELVDTISTVAGVATSKALYLGRYRAEEVKAPELYIVAEEPIYFELKYEGGKKDVADKLTYTNLRAADQAVKGTISVVKKDADSKNIIPSEGVSFEVRAAENITGGDGYVWYTKGQKVEDIATDATGTAQTTKMLRPGKYEIVETSAPYGYVLDTSPVLADLRYANQNTPIVSATAVKENEPTPGDLVVHKFDRETGKPVLTPGTKVALHAAEDIIKPEGTLVYREGQRIGSATIDATGKATTELRVPVGKYYLVEEEAPYGYQLDPTTTYPVEIQWDGGLSKHIFVSAAVSDIPAKGVIAFNKVDASTGKIIPVAGIKAEVFANEDIITGDGTVRYTKDQKVAELTTDDNGNAVSPELYLGSYRVVETYAPVGYLINEIPVDVVLAYEGQTIPVVTGNSKIADQNAMGVIEVVKIDKETGKTVLLPDTTFEVRAKSDIVTLDGTVRATAGELVDTVKTDSTGKGQTKDLFLGIYTITETVAPAGYTLDTEPHDAVIAYKDQHTAIVFSTESVANTAQKGVISVTKTDAESGKPILKAGAVFEIKALEDIYTGDGTLRATADEIVDTIETDETGIAESRALYLGKYEVYETLAPEGYLLTDETKQVELVYGNQTEPLVYEMTGLANTPVKGKISIHKEDSDLDEPLANVEYEIRAKEDIVTGDGEVHHKAGDVIETIITDESGNAESGKLYLGEYVVVETVQPNGYELDETEYPVSLRYADQYTEIVHDGLTLYNTPSSVVVKKVSTSNDELIVPNTKFVGWLTGNEVSLTEPFAVFATPDVSVKSAVVDYMGPFKTVGATGVFSTFELKEKATDTPYKVYAAAEKLEQGNYVLHLSYTQAGKEYSCEMPFAVNEYDANAYFGIGEELIVPNSEDAASFHRLMKLAEKNNEAITDKDDGSEEGENGTTKGEDENAPVPDEGEEQTPAEDDGISVQADDAVVGDEENNAPADDKDDENAPDSSDDATDDDLESPPLDSDNKDDDISSGDTDKEDKKETEITDASTLPIYRVPVVLANAGFAYAQTDDTGTAAFNHVLQGKVAFAEYEAAAGYVSDRTPGYVEIGSKGISEGVEVSGNITEAVPTDNDTVRIDMVFADDQTKLHISKKDITTSEELPGNTLSVYEYKGNGESEVPTENDYGELLDTWVSTDKPHYMELLPQGTYILKEEQAVEGFTVAESIIFRLNDTGVAQHVLMNNEHEMMVADELIELVETGDLLPAGIAVIVITAAGLGWVLARRKTQS